MARLILLNKPYQVLCQFTDKENRTTLADFVSVTGVYPAGRLDYDSEGLLLLTDNGALQARIAEPKQKMPKTYLVQVEGTPSEESLRKLRTGVTLKDGPTLPAQVRKIPAPDLWQRTPPVRQRNNDDLSWLEIIITEGRNRQVRRMTAHIGHPTLRLVRTHIGPWSLGSLPPGEFNETQVHMPASQRDNRSSRPGNGKPGSSRSRPGQKNTSHRASSKQKTSRGPSSRSKHHKT